MLPFIIYIITKKGIQCASSLHIVFFSSVANSLNRKQPIAWIQSNQPNRLTDKLIDDSVFLFFRISKSLWSIRFARSFISFCSFVWFSFLWPTENSWKSSERLHKFQCLHWNSIKLNIIEERFILSSPQWNSAVLFMRLVICVLGWCVYDFHFMVHVQNCFFFSTNRIPSAVLFYSHARLFFFLFQLKCPQLKNIFSIENKCTLNILWVRRELLKFAWNVWLASVD